MALEILLIDFYVPFDHLELFPICLHFLDLHDWPSFFGGIYF